MACIEFAEVKARLGGSEILYGVSGAVKPGAWLAVVGPNGAGKSTLLRTLCGLTPHTGTVRLDGANARALTRRQRARLLAYAPQVPVLPPGMAVADYALLGRLPHMGYLGRESAADVEIIAETLERLDLDPLAQRPLSSLSGGEQQRVVLARALAQRAPVLVLDEPTSSLDLGHQQQLLELIDTLRRNDELTVVTTLHDLTLAGQYADELLVLSRGRVAASGAPPAVLTAELIAEYYGAHVAVDRDELGHAVVRLVRPSQPQQSAPA